MLCHSKRLYMPIIRWFFCMASRREKWEKRYLMHLYNKMLCMFVCARMCETAVWAQQKSRSIVFGVHVLELLYTIFVIRLFFYCFEHWTPLKENCDIQDFECAVRIPSAVVFSASNGSRKSDEINLFHFIRSWYRISIFKRPTFHRR